MAKLSLEEALMLELEKEEKRNANSKLEEKTLKQIYNELPGVDVHDEPIDTSNVDALLDGVIVVTDPTVNKDEYGEVQERAQEIIENTPEGDMPFDEEYVDSYLITCPICGETFTSPELLHPGDTCPVCLQQPEEFVVKGQLKTTEEVSEMAREQEALDDAKIAANEENQDDGEQPVPGVEEQNEEDLEKQTASKEIPEGNKLVETKVEESKTVKTEDTYEDGIFYEIEAALMEAGLNPVRFTEDGVLTNNLGWTVRGKDGTKQQITCDGSYLSESLSTENKLQEASQQVPGTEIKKAADEENNKEVSPDQLPTSGKDIEVLVTENSVGYLLRGLIIDHKNKQFQYVLGQSLPLGKYKRVSKNTIRNTINDLQNEEYKEYKGKDSIELEESVEYAKFAKFKKLV